MTERDKGTFERMGESVGAALGGAAGRANDMATDALGSLFTSALQSMGDWWAGSDAQQVLHAFKGEDEGACREHHATGQGGDFSRARPHYQFGYVAGRNPAYHGKPFDQVEAELQRTWEAAARDDLGEWNEARERVGFAYQR
jgi:hypothetical protein